MANPSALITQGARARGIDPLAALAVSRTEGLGGGIGDGGHAFGPFQGNDAGGVLTGKFPGWTPQQKQTWAMSPQGINYMLDGVAKVSRGLTGQAAVDAIVRRFERPANPDAEVAKATSFLGATLPAGASTHALGSQGSNPGTGRLAGFSPLLANLMAETNKIVGLPSLKFPSLAGFNATTTTPDVVSALPSAVGKGERIAHTALTQLGQDYQWGGRAKLGSHTDCSGLVQATMGANGISVPRTTYDQWKVGTAIDPQHLAPGDAVFFHMTDRGPSHVGIYLGDGKFINDPHTGAQVRVDSLAGFGGFVGARRFA